MIKPEEEEKGRRKEEEKVSGPFLFGPTARAKRGLLGLLCSTNNNENLIWFGW